MKFLLETLVAMCVVSMASGVSAGIIVGNKEWRQVFNFTKDDMYAQTSGFLQFR